MLDSQLTIAGLSKLAPLVVDEMYRNLDPVWLKFGDAGKAKCAEDTAYVLAFLGQALEVEEPELFLSFVDWIKEVFMSLGFPEDTFPRIAQTASRVIRRQYPADQSARALAILDEGVRRHQITRSPEPSHLSPDSPLHELAGAYLTLLLRYDRNEASEIIKTAAARGTSIQDLYQHVFEPCQRELGRLWQTRQISVAQEHYCTAATQLIMAQLHSYIFRGHAKPRAMVAVCVAGELHEVGARMVADMFELAGWSSHYVGANTPTTSTLKLLKDIAPQLLCVSATLTYHVSIARDLISAARANDADGHTRILVGGYPFLVVPSLWQKVGADATARNAVEAVALAGTLVPHVNA